MRSIALMSSPARLNAFGTAFTGPTPMMSGSTPAVATADFGYLRLRAVEYGDDDLRRWLDTMARVGAGWRDAFVFFKH